MRTYNETSMVLKESQIMLNIFKKQESLPNIDRYVVFFGIYLLFIYSFICYLGSTSLKYKNIENCILSKGTDASMYQIALTACTKEIEAEFLTLQDEHSFGYRYQDALNEGYTKIQLYEYLSTKSTQYFTFKSFEYGLNRINSYPESRLVNTIKGALIFGTIGGLIGLLVAFLTLKFKRKPKDTEDLP